jgi:hypothetical protein
VEIGLEKTMITLRIACLTYYVLLIFVLAFIGCQARASSAAAQSCLNKVAGLSAQIDLWAETARRAPLTHIYQSHDELVQSLEGLSKLAREAVSQCEAEKAEKNE